MGYLPKLSNPSNLIPMRKLTVTLCLTLAVLFGSAGMSASADFKKGPNASKSGDYASALWEWKPLGK